MQQFYSTIYNVSSILSNYPSQLFDSLFKGNNLKYGFEKIFHLSINILV